MGQKQYKILGTHCAACEVLIERKFLKIPGVKKVKVNYTSGKTIIDFDQEPTPEQLQKAIAHHGYQVVDPVDLNPAAAGHSNRKPEYLQISAIVLILAAFYVVLHRLNLLPLDFGLSEQMGYGLVFGLGLVASVSTCMAVTGSLLLAVSAQYGEKHPDFSAAKKFKPLLYFNLGRLFGYFLLGGLVGALGSILTLSARVNGLITILASLAMIILGLQILHLFPALGRFQLKLPKFIAHKIHSLSESNSKKAPFLLGSLTFFLPCGFTQALQLYVLSHGGFWLGALIMGIFALGTLPALLAVSVFSSFSKGKVQGYFLKFAGVLVILVGLLSIKNGLVLAGVPLGNFNNPAFFPATNSAMVQDPNVLLIGGKQVVKMKVSGYDYYPARFTVQKGIPVEWEIDGSAASGCMASLVVPKLGLREYVPRDSVRKITFVPQTVGTIEFSCAMGMGTPGAAFIVVDNQALPEPTTCDPRYADCLPS